MKTTHLGAMSVNGLTLDEFAKAKKLDRAFLAKLGLEDADFAGKPAVRIPYSDPEGYECAIRFRLAMIGDRFRWEKGAKPCLYGLRRLKRMRPAGYVVVPEGESDTLTLWSQKFPALGLPSATSWDEGWATHLADFQKVFFVIEPDRGGEALLRSLAESSIRPKAYLLRLEGVKDTSELYMKDPTRFRGEFQKALDQAEPWSASGQPTGKSPSKTHRAKKSQASQLVELVDSAELFHTPDRKPYATLTVGDHQEHWAVKSTQFKQLLTGKFYESEKSVPKAQALQDALNVFGGKALFEGKEQPVHTRVAELGAKYYLDLADEHWRAVEITSDGWVVVDNPPVCFRRARGMAPLPEPTQGGDIHELRRYINVCSGMDWQLTLSWLTAALRPTGPYPILAFHGEQGCGKTTTDRILRSLTDPSTAIVRSSPRDVRDLMITAANSHVVALDNLSYIPDWLSDALCRLATGGGFSTRELYSDDDEIIFEAMRPVLLNGIGELTSKGDLMERTILIYLPQIRKSKRLTEDEFWGRFNLEKPRILGALLEAVSAALREIKSVRLDELPRMADFAKWSTAAEEALGFNEGAFTRAYSCNRQEANTVVLETSPVAACVRKLLQVNDGGSWAGTATKLLEELGELRGPDEQARRTWPKSANGLSVILRRLAPNLRAVGVIIDFDRESGTGQRIIKVQEKA